MIRKLLHDGWEELVSAMDSDEKVGMCASKMLFMKDHGMINSTGINLARSGVCWDRGIFEPDTGQYESMEEVFGPCAGAALYRKSMLDDIGLFDEDFHAYRKQRKHPSFILIIKVFVGNSFKYSPIPVSR